MSKQPRTNVEIMEENSDTTHVREIIRELFLTELLPGIKRAIAESADTQPQQFYSRQAVAKMLGISVQTLDQLISTSQLNVLRIQRRVLIPRTELERLGNSGADDGKRGSCK